ncbi:glycosyltransferase family 2 protein, partial [Capnocytophaga gingivalis]|uniref:glycosyltransferase family 2 protein n=1 Tax=Capnocytophaga gingivalis TaxID=1017 RepID=UPI003C7632B7
MSDKLLTITIPVYNTEEYLPKCLNSLIIDEYMDILEVLIVIDGSPDNSLAIAQEYAQKYPNTFIVINKENGGHSSAINKGLELATGKYFKLLDSDDWFDKDSFKVFIEKLQGLDVDMVMTDYVVEYVSQNKQELVGLNISENTIYSIDQVDITKIQNFLAMHRIAYRTSLFTEVNFKLPEKTFYTDVLYAHLPFFKTNSFVYYKLPLYRYYVGREGQSMNLTNLFRNKTHLYLVFSILYKNYLLYKDDMSVNKKEYFLNFIEKYNLYIFGIL